jgi:hypothetical protein
MRDGFGRLDLLGRIRDEQPDRVQSGLQSIDEQHAEVGRVESGTG